jgi:hypothetical protein
VLDPVKTIENKQDMPKREFRKKERKKGAHAQRRFPLTEKPPDQKPKNAIEAALPNRQQRNF